MRVLIACEFSGIVRDAFIARGHDAMSCDLLPSEKPGPHYQGDVRDVLGQPWGMVIAFPPCTHLAVSGARYWAEKRADYRQQDAAAFFMLFAKSNTPRVCIENPIGFMSTHWRTPDQIVQPWQFGHDASKATCLWLRGLPRLVPTAVVQRERYANQTPKGQSNTPESSHRAHDKSRTFPGIAAAMAEQWSNA